MKDLEKRSLLSDGSIDASIDIPLSYNTNNANNVIPYIPGEENGEFAGYTYPQDSRPTKFQSQSFDRQTSVVDNTVTLCWKNIRVSAPVPETGCCNRLKRNRPPPQVKPILKGVSGIARAGSFLVIMGASGSGKTTLLNVLTHRNLGNLEVEGEILANGRPIGEEVNSVSGYIQQDDLFVGTLTVREHLWFNAVLRMGRDLTDDHRRARVEEVIQEVHTGDSHPGNGRQHMGLKKCENTVVGIPGMVKGISGGEKKRLAFGAELLTRPSIMFCDEPTSGLDSYMAQSVVETLKKLTARGHTVMCTIHQPSSEVFALFDEILLMAEGRVAFLGPTKELEGFFGDHGYTCPPNFNPSDFFIMNLAIVPGRERECRENVNVICDSFEESSFARSIKYQIEEQEFTSKDRFVVEMDKVGTGQIRSDMNDNKQKNFKKQEYQSSWCRQFSMCLWRSAMDAKRNKKVLPAKILQLVLTGLLVGILWWQQPMNQAGISNINGAMFTFLIQCTFNVAFCIATSFSREFPIFVKEHADRQYSTSAYYLGKVLIDLPVISMGVAIYITIAYWMIGLNPGAGNYFITLFAIILLAVTAASWGNVASAIFPNAQMALTLLPFILGLTLLCSGFLIKQDTIPSVFLPVSWISSFKYAYEILVINQWLGLEGLVCEYSANDIVDLSLNLTKTSSLPGDTFSVHEAVTSVPEVPQQFCYPSGLSIIYSFQYDPGNLSMCFVALILLCVGIQLIGYIAFRIRTHRK